MGRKQKKSRLRKAWAKQYRIRNITGANPLVLAEYNERIKSPPTDNVFKDAPEKIRSDNLRQLWQSDFHQGVDNFYFITLVAGRIMELRMYRSGDKCFFMERKSRVLRISKMYSGRDEAMHIWRAQGVGGISWQDIFTLTD